LASLALMRMNPQPCARRFSRRQACEVRHALPDEALCLR
jgi:hypothetical protein